MYGYGYSPFIKSASSSGRTPVDPDAQAFITAAAITDPTQQSAINQLVVDLKGYNVWSKMKALYPFVGGTASQHKWNLKDPRDLDAAFRLVFNGGWSHNSNGITGNGVNTTASTFIVSNSIFNASNGGLSFYCRNTVNENKYDIGYNNFGIALYANESYFMWGDGFPNVARLATRGFYQLNRISSVSYAQFNNSIILTNPSTGNVLSNIISIGSTGAGGFSSRNYAFASISNGLTNTEAANFYTAVQTFQTTLGRSIGTQTVSDADAQAFVTNAGIVDQVEANAVNNLVIGLKADGLWTKMKAIYPFVGGTASTHKFNLKNPLDTDAAFRLVFSGGWTHSSTGALPNGTNAFADTFLANNSLGQNNNHISAYSRTNNTILSTLISSWNTTFGVGIYPLFGGLIYGNNNAAPSLTVSNTDSRGFFLNSRTNNSQFLLQRNTTQNTVNNGSATYITTSFKIGKTGEANVEWANREIAFISLGDGLTNSEATNLYTRVQAFNTTLNRQV